VGIDYRAIIEPLELEAKTKKGAGFGNKSKEVKEKKDHA
jgi:hypothetical protein